MIAKKFLQRSQEDRKYQDLFIMRNCRFDHDKRRTDEQVVINDMNNTTVRLLKDKVTPGPSDYTVLQSSVIGKDGPSYTWQQKTPDKDRKKDFPAPG